jgi:hypothetical protein
MKSAVFYFISLPETQKFTPELQQNPFFQRLPEWKIRAPK